MKIHINIKIEGKNAQKFEELKEKLGLLNNTEVIRQLINRAHEIFLAS